MERNSNEYNRETSDYQPNFILREPTGDNSTTEDGVRRAIDPLEKTADIPAVKPAAEVTPAVEPAAAEVSEVKLETTDATPAVELATATAEPAAPKATIEDAKVEPATDAAPAAAEVSEVKSDAEPAAAEVKPDPLEDDDILSRLAGSTSSVGAFGPQARETVVGGFDSELLKSEEPKAERFGAEQPKADRFGTEQPKTERPRFENPSYDDGGATGSFRDPRENFRFGETASWQSGQSRAGFGPGEKQKRKKKEAKPVTMSKKMLALLVAGCLFLSALFGFGGVLVGSTLVGNQTSDSSSQTTSNNSSNSASAKTETAGYTLESATGSKLSVKEITAKARDSVVEIRTEGVVSDSWMQDYVTEGAGSGVIISEDGYIMTNNHVISGANKIKVTTADEKEYDAELVGSDENSDVAVIKVDATGLTAATFGNSDELEVGDLAVAIGNPLGELGGTVTAGIISAKDRALSIDGKTLHLLQTDSSINPGNSGGGLFNDSGQLIGLVVAKSSGSDVEGLGFAIPINTAANVSHQLMDKGYVSGQPSTGMTYQEGSSNGGGFGSFDSFFGSSSQVSVYIYSVNGANAKKAGFKEGDIVLAVDGEEITSFNDLSAIVTSHKVGDELTFTVQRDGGEKDINLVLEEKQTSNNNNSGNSSQEKDNTEDGQQSQQPEGDQGEFPPVPEDQGGSLFDYFFGQ